MRATAPANPTGQSPVTTRVKTKAARFRWRLRCARTYARLTFVQEHAFGFFGVYWTVVEFV